MLHLVDFFFLSLSSYFAHDARPQELEEHNVVQEMRPVVSGKEASMKQSFLKSCIISRRNCRIRRLLAVHLFMSQMNYIGTLTHCLLKAILRLVLTYPVHLVVPK